MLLFKLGYPELNHGRNFQILIQRKGAKTLSKQIDVFAKDDETVIVAECKACDKTTKRTLSHNLFRAITDVVSNQKLFGSS